jgi:hypothetical protein
MNRIKLFCKFADNIKLQEFIIWQILQILEKD